jgi:hypothetical protein
VCEVKRRCKERRFTASQHAVTALARYDSGNLSKQNVMEGNGISEVPIATSLPESIHFVVNYDGGETYYQPSISRVQAAYAVKHVYSPRSRQVQSRK